MQVKWLEGHLEGQKVKADRLFRLKLNIQEISTKAEVNVVATHSVSAECVEESAEVENHADVCRCPWSLDGTAIALANYHPDSRAKIKIG